MENHTNKTYQERMNKTALSKFGAIKKHLKKASNYLISAQVSHQSSSNKYNKQVLTTSLMTCHKSFKTN